MMFRWVVGLDLCVGAFMIYSHIPLIWWILCAACVSHPIAAIINADTRAVTHHHIYCAMAVFIIGLFFMVAIPSVNTSFALVMYLRMALNAMGHKLVQDDDFNDFIYRNTRRGAL